MIEVLRLLHEMETSAPRHSGSYYVRSLDRNEDIPQFGHDIINSPLAQRDWIWIAFSSLTDEPLALIAASPMHGVAMFVRAYAIDKAPRSVFVGLFRKSLADIHKRGYTQYAAYLDLSRPEEAKIARLVRKAGGLEKGNQTLFHGSTDISRW